MMTTDMTLVREYADRQSEAAFEQLVARHLNLVYATALRQAGDVHLAEEIAQTVFLALARKAGKLGDGTIVAAWLYRATRYATADALKQRRRQQQREQEAYMQSLSTDSSVAEAWQQIGPILDAALDSLAEADRAAVLLRYFEDKSLAEVGDTLGLSADAARMRVNRALEKLRNNFVKQGVTFGTPTIAGAIAAQALHVAPAALAKTITLNVVALGAAAGGSTLTLEKGISAAMSGTRWKLLTAGLGATVLIGVVLLGNWFARQDDSYEITGVYASTNYLNNQVVDTRLIDFTIYVNNDRWTIAARERNHEAVNQRSLQTVALFNDIRATFDGKQSYVLRNLLTIDTAQRSSNKAVGSIAISSYPLNEDSAFLGLWLGYCSRFYWAGIQNEQSYPVFSIGEPPPKIDGSYLVRGYRKMLPGNRSLPAEVVFTYDFTFKFQDAAREKFWAQWRSHTNVLYAADVVTNLGSFKIPTHFSVDSYAPEGSLRSHAVVTATNVRTAPHRSITAPALPGMIYITDRRFLAANPDVPVGYTATNWLSLQQAEREFNLAENVQTERDREKAHTELLHKLKAKRNGK